MTLENSAGASVGRSGVPAPNPASSEVRSGSGVAAVPEVWPPELTEETVVLTGALIDWVDEVPKQWSIQPIWIWVTEGVSVTARASVTAGAAHEAGEAGGTGPAGEATESAVPVVWPADCD